MTKWESEKHNSVSMPAEGFIGHVATDGSLLVPLGGKHAVGQWCSWSTMKRWSPCTGCTARWKQNLKSTAPSRGGADGLLVTSQECDWTHQGAC